MRELEVKLKVEGVEPLSLVTQLERLRWPVTGPATQVDDVFARNRQDVMSPSEGSVVARVRSDSDRGRSMTVKVRRSQDLDRSEFELAIDSASTARHLLEALGLEHLVTVHKERWTAKASDVVTVCVDSVRGLGTFMEVELLSEEGDDQSETQLRGFVDAVHQELPGRKLQLSKTYDRLLLENSMSERR